MDTARIIVLAIAALAVWTWVVASFDDKERRDLRVKRVALLNGIWYGFLAAVALGLIGELAGAEWPEPYLWALGLGVCAIVYVRRTYRAGC
jgi:hypothetical protein